jgi:5'-nucleotidase
LLILLTNDDGIHSEGLIALRERLSKKHDVYVVAPERERTCVGHAITLHKPLRMQEAGDRMYSSNGTPADCILLGVNVVLPEKPDFVISGINKGPNMGQDVNYSGTVAAAKEGAFLGISSLAVSVCARTGFHFPDAAEYTEDILDSLKNNAFQGNVFLNINIPNVPHDNIKGFMVTRLGKRVYNDTVFERTDPRGGRYYWIGGNSEGFELIEGTDFHAVEKGYVSVTPLALDATSVSSINTIKKRLTRRSL